MAARARGDRRFESSSLPDLAWIAVLDGRFADASRLAPHALRMHDLIRNTPGLSECIIVAVWFSLPEGKRSAPHALVGAGAAAHDRSPKSPSPKRYLFPRVW